MRECREYEALISAAVDGAVTEAERRELMGHLAACAACRETYEQTMLIHEALAGWEAEEPPAALADRVSNKYIASFLGMTPVTLSRLRRALREQAAPGRTQQGGGQP